MPVKLTSKQYRIIAIAVTVAAASLIIGLKYFSRAFPEAAIQFLVNRGDSEHIAQQFLEDRGFHLAGYRHAAVFSYDDDTKLYLERTQGLERMDRLTRGPIHLWRWSHRWFRPQQVEEFDVDVSPSGQVVGFDHAIPEDAPGASLSEGQARARAEQFLTGVMKHNLDDLEFVEGESQTRPHRTDYTFTWKQKNVNLGNGSLRIEVGIDGDRVASSQEYVKIPEDWLRGYQKLRSRNVSAQIVDQVFWVLLSLAMLVLLVRRLRDGDVPLKISLVLGLVAAGLAFASQLNSFPLAKFSYPTTDSYSSFLSGYMLEALLGALGLGVLIFLVVASSEPVYREGFPGLISFRRYFTWQGLRTRSFLMANIVGIALAVFFFAYQTVFYLAANHLGAWAPSDIPFSNQLNTRIPWVAVLFTGFFPAVSEEMQFRAFAIPFLKKVTRSWPLAIALAAFNWGFLHSAYPNEPFFIRGVEVGVGGIIIGIIMLRFGILATLMWHYSVDALYTAFLLLRSPNHYLMISGGASAGVMLIPLVVALVAYVASGTFAEEGPVTNASEGISRISGEEASPEPELLSDYRPLSRRKLLAALCLVVIFAGLSFLKVYHLGQGVKLRTTRSQAMRAADDFLKSRAVDPATYRSVAWLEPNVDPLAARYFLERLSVPETDRILRRASQPLLWEVRFFHPLQKEEHLVFVNATNGKVFDYRHIIDETAPGAALSAAQALALGEKAVAENGYDLSGFILQSSQAIKRKAREDYTLVWQAKPGDPRNVADAHYRLQVDIAGDQVMGFSRNYKLPEQWLRRQQSRKLSNSILLGISILLGAGLIAGGVWLLVREVRKGSIRWLSALKVAIVLAIVLALEELNGLSSIGRNYDTSISLSSFRLEVGVSFLVAVIGGGALLWLAIALMMSLYPKSWQVLRGASRRIWRRDAIIALVTALAVSSGLERLLSLFANHFHAYVPVSFLGASSALDAYSPAFGIFFRGVVSGVGAAAALGILIYGVCLGWRRRAWWFWLGLALVLVALGPAGAHSSAEFALGWLDHFIPLLAAVVILMLFFRDNSLAYVAAAFCSVVAGPLLDLFSQPITFYRWNGALLALLAALVLIWLFLPGPKRKTSSSFP